MGTRNSHTDDLSVAQIAAHLHTRPWNINRELKLGEEDPNRLQGHRTRIGPGRGGPWRVKRQTYLRFLNLTDLPEAPEHQGPDGLPELVTINQAADKMGILPAQLKRIIRQRRWPHVVFGRNQYLTHNQLASLHVLVDSEPPGSQREGADQLMPTCRETRQSPGAEGTTNLPTTS